MKDGIKIMNSSLIKDKKSPNDGTLNDKERQENATTPKF